MAWPEGIVRFGGTRHNSTPVCGQSNVVQPIYKSCWMPVCCCCSTFRTQTFHSSFAVFAIRTINSAAFWRPLLLCAGGDSSAFFHSALWNRTQCQCYWIYSGWMGIKGECGWKPTTTTAEHFIKPFIIIIRITESSSSSCTDFHIPPSDSLFEGNSRIAETFFIVTVKDKNKTTKNTYCGM